MSNPRIKAILTADSTDFERKLKQAKGSIAETGKALSIGLAGGAAVATAGIYAANRVMSEAVDLANVQEQAETKLSAVLRATGGAAGFNFEELKKMASGYQEVTTYGDEVTMSAMSILATFKQVRGEGFERATAAAMDMSAVMGTELNSSILQVGKALNDPTKGLSMLTRVGVTFTEQQKDQIKGLQAAGDMYGAQSIILRELETQFGGTAEALRENFKGAVTGAENALGDMKEELGFVITKNQFFIDIAKLTEAQFVKMGAEINNNQQYYMELAKTIVVDVVDSLGAVIETMRFVHNGWLGLKLVGTATVEVLAAGIANLYDAFMSLLYPLDQVFKAAVKLGVMDGNPLDAISGALHTFKQSSADVTGNVLADIAKTNAAYDKAKSFVDGVVTKLDEVEVSARETGSVVREEFDQNTQSVAGTTAEFVKLNKSIYDTGQSYDVQLPQWMKGTDSLTKNIADLSDTHDKLSETVKANAFDMAEYSKERWEEAFNGMQNSLSDFLKTGEYSFDSLLDLFEDMLADMVAAWVMNTAKMEVSSWLGDSGSGIIGAIADLFSSDSSSGGGIIGTSGSLFSDDSSSSGGNKSGGNSGTGALTTGAGVIGKGYEMYTGKSLTSTGWSYLKDWWSGTSTPTTSAGTGVGTGIGTGVGSGIYTGMGSTAIGGSSGLGSSGIPLSSAGGIAPTQSGYTMGSGLSSMSSSSGGGSVSAAGGSALGTSMVAGVFAMGISMWIGEMMKPDKPQQSEIMNKMGLTPDYFAGAVGDSFKAGMNPVYGNMEQQMLDAESGILTQFGGLGSKLAGMKVFDEAKGGWVDITNAMHAFEMQTVSMTAEQKELVAAQLEAEMGISGLAEEILDATDQMKTGIDKTKDSMLAMMGPSGELTHAMKLAEESLTTVSHSTGELEEYLSGLGYTQAEVTTMLSGLNEQLSTMGGEAYNLGLGLGGVNDYMTALVGSLGDLPDFSEIISPSDIPDNTENPNAPHVPTIPDEQEQPGNQPPENPNMPHIPGMATGAIVKGPTFSLVGEGLYPELVAPLPDGPNMLSYMRDDIKSLQGGGGPIIVEVFIDGNDIIDTQKLDARIRVKYDEMRVATDNRKNIAGRRLFFQ